jgi:hypothetical protein
MHASSAAAEAATSSAYEEVVKHAFFAAVMTLGLNGPMM